MIDDALNCLFNAFDHDRSGRISYKKLCEGLEVLCENHGATTNFDRGSEIGFGETAQRGQGQSFGNKQKVVAIPPQNEQIRSDNNANRPEKNEPVAVKPKRETKADRDKKVARSGNMSVMEKQNAMRAEAAKKKKEEAAKKRAAKLAAGGGEEPKLDRLQT